MILIKHVSIVVLFQLFCAILGIFEIVALVTKEEAFIIITITGQGIYSTEYELHHVVYGQ